MVFHYSGRSLSSSLFLIFVCKFSDAWTITKKYQNHNHHKQQRRHHKHEPFYFRISKKKISDAGSLVFTPSLTSTSVLALGASTEEAISDNNSKPELFLFNSKSRSKERFETIIPNKVSMYTCGPTVYDYAHVGNFRAFLTYDLIKRVLLYFGYDVTHVCNLTDVDDKIINRANEMGMAEGSISELTQRYENYFFQDLKALNVILANNYPRATEHVPEMMEMILQLADKNLAYETNDGSWYFATSNQEGYGTHLVQLNADEMNDSSSGNNSDNNNNNNSNIESVVGDDTKRNFQDFALWKAYKENIDRDDASWTDPSGRIRKGRPGWHIECSAMARKYLGDTIDVHGGGCDLQFPHHENEIAQSEGVTGRAFCNCWIHNGFVNINDEKMSKSLGNFLTLRTACPKSDDVRAFRFFVMSSQYQKQLSFTPQAMDAARRSLKRIDKVLQRIDSCIIIRKEVKNNFDHVDDDDQENNHRSKKSPLENDISKALGNFDKALSDDLSMPRASASLFALIKLAETEFKRAKKAAEVSAPDDGSTSEEQGGDENDAFQQQVDSIGLQNIKSAIQQMDRIFGIFYEVPLSDEKKEEASTSSSSDSDSSSDDNDDEVIIEVMDLVAQRIDAKESKDWDLADSLRARIVELGFAVKDVKGGDPVVSKIEL